MDNFSSILLTIFGGIITLALVSVIVGRKSQAPQAIQAIGGAISNVVAAAVNPVSADYGFGNGNSTSTSPAYISGLASVDMSSAFTGLASSIFSGSSK